MRPGVRRTPTSAGDRVRGVEVFSVAAGPDGTGPGGTPVVLVHGLAMSTRYLEPVGITQYRLAQATGLSQTRISEIIRGTRRITPETALRLAKALGLSERFWLNVQNDYEIESEHHNHPGGLDEVEVLIVA